MFWAYKYATEYPFLDAFAKLRKATTSFIMYVCPTVRPFARMEYLGSNWTDFHEI